MSRNANCLGSTVAEWGWAPTARMENPDSFGLEIEMEGVPRRGIQLAAGVPKGWQQHEDGSLRNGTEFTSNGPRTLKQIDEDLDGLIKAFNDAKFLPVFSFRTSLHVHVNVSDLTHLQLLNMFALYVLFEQPLLELGGEERIGNVHCMPVFLAQYPLEELRRGLRGTSYHLDESLRRLANNNNRYASFNFSALSKFGTIEFRSHHGTLDKAEIIRWVSILNELKQQAKTFESPVDVVQSFSRLGPVGFTTMIFTDPTIRGLCAKNPKRLWEGVRNVQLFAYATPDWTAQRTSGKSKRKSTLADMVNEQQALMDAPPVNIGRAPWNEADMRAMQEVALRFQRHAQDQAQRRFVNPAAIIGDDNF